jgi:hypothetical protein
MTNPTCPCGRCTWRRGYWYYRNPLGGVSRLGPWMWCPSCGNQLWEPVKKKNDSKRCL